MKNPAGTIVQVLGGLMVAGTVTPIVMGLGALSPQLVLVFVLGLALLYAGSRMKRQEPRESDASPREAASAAPSTESEVTDEDLDDAGVNRAPDGTPTSPGVDEQSGIRGM